jgi:hypothetical protein
MPIARFEQELFGTHLQLEDFYYRGRPIKFSRTESGQYD